MAHDDSRRDDARRLYEGGHSSYEIAAELGMPAATVQGWVRDIARPRGAPKNGITDQRILDYRDSDGLAYARIARLVGMSETGVRNRYYALTGRPRAERATVQPRDRLPVTGLTQSAGSPIPTTTPKEHQMSPAVQMISRHTDRPAGATGVRWAATSFTECFATIDASTAGFETAAAGEFITDPALTGGDDCACNACRDATT